MAELKTGGAQGYLRIATEEAFAPPEMMAAYVEVLDGQNVDPGFESLMGFYMRHKSERATNIFRRLQDLGAERLADMDARGIDRQVIGVTAPGVQVLTKDKATALSVLANDQLADACRKHPDRFTGMAAVAPQDPAHAAKELERAVKKLGMRAAVINSHTHGEYLSDQKFWPILEAAEALDVPIYLHPQTPPKAMIAPFLEAGLDGAVFGFGVETGFHALRLIGSGAFDRFPKLQFLLGHMGEALPFWMYRLDYMYGAGLKSKRYPFQPQLKHDVSHYLKHNFHITNSGVAWEPAIKFTQAVLGEDRVLYAMDYPYQCPPEEVEILDRMDMAPATKKKFFQTNAEKLFKL
ncbi:MAG: amidohydrolase [Hyphomonadaceae bacterium]|nr:amidohydrolase [Hyphomonadaceae bacterium]